VSKYLLTMKLCFDTMLNANMGNTNSDMSHIKCSRRLQVPHPCFTITN